MSASLDRRAALKLGAATIMAFGLGFWKQALAAPATVGRGPYGRLQAADALGIRLPAGFTARALAITSQPVMPSDFPWIGAPDGAATFAGGDGGWVYAANSELPTGSGGVAAINFSVTGEVIDAYRILSGTSRNCSGGATPWGTWLSGEEVDGGLVFCSVWIRSSPRIRCPPRSTQPWNASTRSSGSPVASVFTFAPFAFSQRAN